MSSQGPKGLERIVRATVYSFKGIKQTFASEAAFRQELALVVILLPLAVWLGDTGLEKALMISALVVVLIVELLNTGIEATVDRFGGDQHELSGYAKDAGSAAVFLSLINVLVVWGLVLLA